VIRCEARLEDLNWASVAKIYTSQFRLSMNSHHGASILQIGSNRCPADSGSWYGVGEGESIKDSHAGLVAKCLRC
jgi:hypothetical protein